MTTPRNTAESTAGATNKLAAPDIVRRFRIVGVDGVAEGRQWESRGDRCSIGSHPSNDFVVDDTTVSRFHCEIRIEPRGARLRDLDSKNGSFVDGTSVLECWLRSGSTLRVGRSTLRFELVADMNPLPASSRTHLGRLVGHSASMRTTFAMLERAAATDVTVLLEGETGTGKQGAAEAIHAEGARAEGPFVTVDAGSLPASLLESELFGHEKGAFTGADERRIGAFEEAHGGTLFLDEIGEMPQDLQPKLLRALEQREIRRVGTNHFHRIDVRVIAATNRDLRAEVNAGRFREDLYFRLAVVKIPMPPLRARPEDIPILVDALLEDIGAPDTVARSLTAPAFLDGLARGAWPGNVRELRNYLQRCVVFEGAELPLGEAAKGSAHDVDVDIRRPWAEERARVVAEFERAYLSQLLEAHGGKVADAARAAGLDRVYTYKLLRRHGLGPRRG